MEIQRIELPLELAQARERFDSWRSENRPRAWVPAELWQQAEVLAVNPNFAARY